MALDDGWHLEMSVEAFFALPAAVGVFRFV